MKILITGGCGFIGSHITDLLVKAGHEVEIIDNLLFGNVENLEKNTLDKVKLYNVDFVEAIKKPKYVKDKDVIIHCAAQVSTFSSVTDPDTTFRTNIVGTYNLFESVRKNNPTARIIYTSSRSVMGESVKGDYEYIPLNEDTKLKPLTHYNLSKIYGEYLSQIYHKLYGINYTILRPSNVYGPRMPNKGLYGFIGRWIAYAMKGQPMPIWGSGTQSRDYVYVEDVAEAYLRCIRNPDASINKTYLLSTGEGVDLIVLAKDILYYIAEETVVGRIKFDQDFVENLWDMTNKELEERGLLKFYPAKKGDIQAFIGDSSKIQKELNMKFRNIDKGLSSTVKWVEKNIKRYDEYNLT